MGKKYFVWSFDDGLEQDKRIVEILRSFHMGATFNLNSGLYGKQQMIGRIGNFGFKEVPVSDYQRKKHHLLKYVPHRRIPEDEVVDVYKDFEIAAHAVGHERLTDLSSEEVCRNVSADVESLTRTFQQPVTGFAYPFGAVNDDVKEALQKCGIAYARTVKAEDSFTFPKDPLNMGIACWHITADAMAKVDRFVSMEAQETDMLFLMFAHGYEFDFETKESSWEKFKRICDRVAGKDDVICCSTGDAFRDHFKYKETIK